MIQIARDIKALYPGIGTEKLRLVSQTMFPDMEVPGRDRYHALIREYGLINKRRKGKSTTNSNHRFRKYKFLAKGVVPTSFGSATSPTLPCGETTAATST